MFRNLVVACLGAVMTLGLASAVSYGQSEQGKYQTADQLLKITEMTATREHKNIMLVFGASWCGPCHQFQSFLDDPKMHPIVSRHFVQLNLISGERPDDKQHRDTPRIEELIDSLHERDTGLPLIVMLGADGKKITDSVWPVYGRRDNHANIGYPATPRAIAWFLEMLRRSAPSLSAEESKAVEAWLVQHAGNGSTAPE